jgi:uncharacterized protein (DUF1499 family)
VIGRSRAVPFLTLVLLACGGTPPMSQTPTADAARARYAEGPSDNVALAEWLLPEPPDRVLGSLKRAARTLPRWDARDDSGQVLWLTRRTRIFRFVDDITALAEAEGSGTRLLLRSASRVGKSDLGQNARNLQELRRAFDAAP